MTKLEEWIKQRRESPGGLSSIKTRVHYALLNAGDDPDATYKDLILSARLLSKAQLSRIPNLARVGIKFIYQQAMEYDALEKQEALKDFVRWAIREGAWQGADLDGGEIQHKAKELGLIQETTYDPDKHGECDWDTAPGEPWYVFSDWLEEAK